MSATTQPRSATWARTAGVTFAVNLAIVGCLWWGGALSWVYWMACMPLCVGLAAFQLMFGVAALVVGIRERRTAGGAGIAARVIGAFATLAAIPGLFVAAMGMLLGMGGGWGRPLRARGRQVHPALREGADWEQGERPD